MKNILKLVPAFIASLLLAGCFLMYKPTIQQGNIITPDMVEQLHPGLPQEQVRYIMGTPVLQNPLNPNRWDYVYTYQKGSHVRQQQHIALFFSNGILQSIQTTPMEAK